MRRGLTFFLGRRECAACFPADPARACSLASVRSHAATMSTDRPRALWMCRSSADVRRPRGGSTFFLDRKKEVEVAVRHLSSAQLRAVLLARGVWLRAGEQSHAYYTELCRSMGLEEIPLSELVATQARALLPRLAARSPPAQHPHFRRLAVEWLLVLCTSHARCSRGPRAVDRRFKTALASCRIATPR